MKFKLGQLVSTPGALDTFSPEFLAECLKRHAVGDWGNVCADDKVLNDEALDDGSRVLSSYEKDGKKMWIITEADRSATTLLLPDEY